MIIGAGIEMVYVGMVHTGGNISVDECLAGTIAIPLALTLNLDATTAIALAVPFGLLGSLMDQLKRFINGFFATKADQYAADGNVIGIRNSAWLYPLIVGFFLRFPPVFIINYLGADYVQNILEALPEWFTHGLTVAGGVLPALGFSITLMIIGKRNFGLAFVQVRLRPVESLYDCDLGIFGCKYQKTRLRNVPSTLRFGTVPCGGCIS